MYNQKGLVQRIERKLEDSVGDAFARMFGGSIVPQEIEALLRREASDGVQALPGDRFLAPNDRCNPKFQNTRRQRPNLANRKCSHLTRRRPRTHRRSVLQAPWGIYSGAGMANLR